MGNIQYKPQVPRELRQFYNGHVDDEEFDVVRQDVLKRDILFNHRDVIDHEDDTVKLVIFNQDYYTMNRLHTIYQQSSKLDEIDRFFINRAPVGAGAGVYTSAVPNLVGISRDHFRRFFADPNCVYNVYYEGDNCSSGYGEVYFTYKRVIGIKRFPGLRGEQPADFLQHYYHFKYDTTPQTIYRGEFREGVAHGSGELHLRVNGMNYVYQGEFYNGRRSGRGYLMDATGAILSGGIWHDDVLVDRYEGGNLKDLVRNFNNGLGSGVSEPVSPDEPAPPEFKPIKVPVLGPVEFAQKIKELAEHTEHTEPEQDNVQYPIMDDDYICVEAEIDATETDNLI